MQHFKTDPRALVGAALALTLAGCLPAANAQSELPLAEDPAPTELDLSCRVFQTDVRDEHGGIFETHDETDPVGVWVTEQRAEGWQVHSTDFELGTKSTGYPIAYTQVCLSRAR
jgi:hypothetical protein